MKAINRDINYAATPPFARHVKMSVKVNSFVDVRLYQYLYLHMERIQWAVSTFTGGRVI